MKLFTKVVIVIFLVLIIGLYVYLVTRDQNQKVENQTDTEQPDSSIKITNLTTENPFYVFLPYSNVALDPPPVRWTKLSGSGDIGDPVVFGKGGQPANDAGAGTWQILTMKQGDTITMKIPDFIMKKDNKCGSNKHCTALPYNKCATDEDCGGQAWTIRPVKKIDGKFCTGGAGNCGMPTLIEAGKEMVADMSAVDGVNFLIDYTLSSKGSSNTRMNFSTNPCSAIGAPSSKGCHNPAVDGQFKSGTTWDSPNCRAGVCNLIGKSKIWCDAIHTGQKKPWTYCYSHDDADSSPRFNAPYKITLVYKDLN